MIVELSTNFNDTEKSLLSKWADVDVKLYIDLGKLIDRFYVWDEKNNTAIGKLIEKRALELPEMIPNRMIGVDSFWLVERKNELGLWYLEMRGADGIYSCCGCYEDLEKALNAI